MTTIFWSHWPFFALGACGFILALVFYLYLRWLKYKGNLQRGFKTYKFSTRIRRKLHVDACCICLESFVLKEIIAVSICNHIFHLRCLEVWLKVKNECPLCKRLCSTNSEHVTSSTQDTYQYCG